ncbi:hypothetical protein NMG60_11030202 [Bertholletia excelsa]
MKREGRQHGMVWSYRILPSPWNPRLDSRIFNRFDSPPTANFFARVSANHSKLTGKCDGPRRLECHIHLATKSKDKAKGNQKVRSSATILSYGLATSRKPGLKFAGFSAISQFWTTLVGTITGRVTFWMWSMRSHAT